MSVALIFHHGWAFDASIWRDVVDRLPWQDCRLADRGYFGAASEVADVGPCIVIAHSMGTMQALADLPSDCRGLVAINGFDRFAADSDFPGVLVRVLDRMIARLGDDPAATVRDFRHRCGDDAPVATLKAQRLGQDLRFLRDGDCRSAVGRLPILSLQGAADPILPPAMRDAVFADAGAIERRRHPEGGHLLPLTDPDWCVAAIRSFAGAMA